MENAEELLMRHKEVIDEASASINVLDGKIRYLTQLIVDAIIVAERVKGASGESKEMAIQGLRYLVGEIEKADEELKSWKND